MANLLSPKKIFSREWFQSHSNQLFSYGGLVFCLLLFSVLSPIIKDVNILDPGGLAFRSILRDGVILSILSCGAVFVYALGAMDISVGAQMSLYSILMVHIYNASNSSGISVLVGFLFVLFLAILSGIINSIIASVLRIIPIITSLFIMFLFLGIAAALFQIWSPQSEAMAFDIGTAALTHFAVFRKPWMQVLVLVLVALFFSYLFNYTKLGKYTKAIGANLTCATQAGINVTRYKLYAYLAFAFSIAIASLVFVANSGTTTASSGVGNEMKIMVCLILGGMPLTGGMRSRISSAVAGSFTYALISRSFIFLAVPDKFTLFFVAVIFIVLVSVTSRSKAKTLPT